MILRYLGQGRGLIVAEVGGANFELTCTKCPDCGTDALTLISRTDNHDVRRRCSCFSKVAR